MTDFETNTEASALVDALADAARRQAALAALTALGDSARAAVRAGLGDGRWEVRRTCVTWAMHCPAADDVAALAPLLRDPKSKVRQAALVAVALARPPAANAQVIPLVIERALEDESLRVRRQAVSLLAWRHAHPDLAGLFAQLAEGDGDEKLRSYARTGLARAVESRPC